MDGTQQRTRFGLILLSEGEHFFEDHAATYSPPLPDHPFRLERQFRPQKLKGRVFVCSQSLIFEPQELDSPIYKIPFKLIDRFGGAVTEDGGFVVSARGTVEMRERGENRPYRFRDTTAEHLFSLRYTAVDSFLLNFGELLRLFREAEVSFNEMGLMELVEKRERDMQFDPSNLVSISERQLCDEPVVQVRPLVHNPGRLVATDTRIYFQPLYRVDAAPVEVHTLASVARVFKRRYMLRHTGIELYFDDGTSTFFSFASPAKRDSIYSLIVDQPALPATARGDMGDATERWRRREISNFQYLLYLNHQACRSFNDLTQYPVFPWIVSDYTSPVLDLNNPETFRDLSKPVGALNAQRLARFRERYVEMPEPKFLYGTHYSTPGYVLYFMVRQVPEYMLRLQNGRFDHPDRLFHSVAESWASVNTNPTDLKELIPEFYMQSGFLLNKENLDLGVRSNGTRIGDVVLPPWAKDPDDFVEKMKEALECEYVSLNIHKWIDLIFGYKQRPPEAIAADNLFYYLTYEGAVDMERVRDEVEKKSLEAQIREFGQTPSQIFTSPHPQRLPKQQQSSLPPLAIPASLASDIASPVTPPSPYSGRHGAMLEMLDTSVVVESSAVAWEPDDLQPRNHVRLHKEAISSCCVSSDGNTLYTVSQDASIRVYSLSEKRQLRFGTLNLALTSCQLLQDENYVCMGSWDNMLYLYNIKFGRVCDSISAHDDAVSCTALRGDVLVSGSWDTTVKVWQCRPSGISRVPTLTFADCDCSVTCVDVENAKSSLIVSGCEDGSVALHDVRTPGSCPLTFHEHHGSVSVVKMFGAGSRVMTGGEDGTLRVMDTSGMSLIETHVGSSVKSLATLEGGSKAIVGTADGEVQVWDLRGQATKLGALTMPDDWQPEGAVTSVAAKVVGENVFVCAGDESGTACWWTL